LENNRESQIVSGFDANAISVASARLWAGNLVAFPTETVYGLGADACNADAVARIYLVKGRPVDHPLIVHVASIDALGDWAVEVPDYAISLAREFWPGPLTLVLKRSELAKDFVTGGQDTIGLRVPNHPVALALIEAFARMGGRGVAAPSANRFGNVSPTTAQSVEDELINYLFESDQVLDGGPCDVGVESTIIECTGVLPRILRPGGVTEEMIKATTGLSDLAKYSTDAPTPRVSGSLEKHYAPVATIHLDQTPLVGQGFIALAQFHTPAGVTRLAAPKDAKEFARDLYSALRKADELGLPVVVVEQPKGSGIAIAIRDRLSRAAQGR
jgi:L-threonylcarbamoyladenylate synthase